MCCTPFRLLSQDFGMRKMEDQRIRVKVRVVLGVELRGRVIKVRTYLIFELKCLHDMSEVFILIIGINKKINRRTINKQSVTISHLLVLLVTPLTSFPYLFGPFLSEWIISHYSWHICWLTPTFKPCFTFLTLCPDYINNPAFLYIYWTRLPVYITCSYLLTSNK